MNDEKGTSRVEAFSDGVFAIAITLLVLDLKVPEGIFANERDLLDALRSEHLLASYLAFFLSFVSILVMWVNHHRIFSVIRRVDDAFLYWNGLLLFFVTLVPFPTALLADHLNGGAGKVAAAIYSGTAVGIALSFSALWRHARRNKANLIEGHEATVHELRHHNLGPIAYLVAFGLSFVSARLSVGLCVLLVVAFAFRGLTSRK